MEKESRLPRISGGELAGIGVIGSVLLSAAIAASSPSPDGCLPYHDYVSCDSVELQKTEDAVNLGWSIMIGGSILSLIGGIAYNEVEFRKRNKTNTNSDIPLTNGS